MKLRSITLQILAVSTLAISAAAVAQTTAPAQKLSSADRSFLEKAAQAGYTEIQGSKTAQEKAKSADVKTFAQQMITDHTKVGDELSALAAQKGYTPPTGPSIVQKTKLTTMGALSGHRFDSMYANQIGVSAHEDAVKLFKKAAASAKDPDVKAFAAKNEPALEQHLSMAQDLKKKVAAEK
jgi:putative membrane protein